MKKKLLTLGIGLAIVATSVAAVSANEEVKVPEVESGIEAQNNTELREFGGFYGGMNHEEILAQIAEEKGISVEELQEQFIGIGNGFQGGMMRGFSDGYGYNEELLQERAAEAGLTVEEYIEKQHAEREAFREVRREEIAERMGISVDELEAEFQGRCGGGKSRGGRGMGYRF